MPGVGGWDCCRGWVSGRLFIHPSIRVYMYVRASGHISPNQRHHPPPQPPITPKTTGTPLAQPGLGAGGRPGRRRPLLPRRADGVGLPRHVGHGGRHQVPGTAPDVRPWRACRSLVGLFMDMNMVGAVYKSWYGDRADMDGTYLVTNTHAQGWVGHGPPPDRHGGERLAARQLPGTCFNKQRNSHSIQPYHNTPPLTTPRNRFPYPQNRTSTRIPSRRAWTSWPSPSRTSPSPTSRPTSSAR